MGLFWGLFLGLAARAVAVQTRTVTSALRGAQRWLCQQAAVPWVAQHRVGGSSGLVLSYFEVAFMAFKVA
jgi:hypothetical protein